MKVKLLLLAIFFGVGQIFLFAPQSLGSEASVACHCVCAFTYKISGAFLKQTYVNLFKSVSIDGTDREAAKLCAKNYWNDCKSECLRIAPSLAVYLQAFSVITLDSVGGTCHLNPDGSLIRGDMCQ